MLALHGAGVVVLADRDEAVRDAATAISQAHETQGDHKAPKTRVISCVGDVSDGAFVREVFDIAEQAGLSAQDASPDNRSTAEQSNPVRICIPAAGITRDALAAKLDKTTGEAARYPAADFETVLRINLAAPSLWACEMYARIAEHRHRRGLRRWSPDEAIEGVAVLIGSVSSRGNPGQIAYAASKAGLVGVAETLAMEGVFLGCRCLVVHPGFTQTPMVKSLGEDLIAKKVLPQTRLGRLLNTSEITSTIAFAIENDGASGPIWVDGGWRPAS